MYESHFGFHAQPFQLNPDPAFYFNSRGHGRALAYLQYGVTQSEGFIVITGEIGAGKTTLVRMLLDGLDRQKVLPAQIVSTQLESGELLQTIITAFGIPASGTSKPHLIATLEAFLTALAAQGRHALLIVDEAQNLGPHAVEELRMLSNFQLGNKALLQSFLVGQPELRRVLESPSMEQLRQRVTASYHLGPLGLEETQGYVEHRLTHVGWNGRPAFEPGAYDHLYRWTGGVPRRINRLCNRVLLACFLDGAEAVTAALVERTALELRQEIGEADFTPLELPLRAAMPAEPAAPPTAVEVSRPAPAVADGGRGTVDLILPAFDGPLSVPAPALAGAVADLGSTSNDVADVAALPSPEPLAAELASPAPAELDSAAQDAQALERAAQAYAAELQPPAAELIDDVDALLAASAQHLATIAAQAQAESNLDLDAVAQRVMAVRPVEAPQATAVQRTDKPVSVRRQGVLLCVADTASAALKFAALAKRLHEQPDGPRMVLLNPGLQAAVWPWDRMERLLPALEVGLHLGAPADAGLERVLPMIHDRVLRVIDEFHPTAMLTLGDGEGVLAAVLCARRAQLPVLRLEAGLQHASEGAAGGASVNAALLDQLADLLFASARPLALRGLQRQGIAAERVYSIPGLLQVDALAQVWKEVSTAYGAFMRHGLPIYLGPTWSEHAGAGTPYTLAALAIDPNRAGAAGEAVARLLALPATDKIVWLVDRTGMPALRQHLAEQAAERPDLANGVVLVDGDAPRDATLRERMDQARILCRQVDSLPDQLSMLRGATWAALEAGQVLVDAADLLNVPCLLARGDGWLPAAGVGAAVVAFDSDGAGRLALQAWIEAVEPAPSRDALPEAGGAVEAVQSHLRAWLARRQAGTSVAVPLAA